MGAGKCVESDTPIALASNEESEFRRMINALGEQERKKILNQLEDSTIYLT